MAEGGEIGTGCAKSQTPKIENRTCRDLSFKLAPSCAEPNPSDALVGGLRSVPRPAVPRSLKKERVAAQPTMSVAECQICTGTIEQAACGRCMHKFCCASLAPAFLRSIAFP